MFKKTLNLILIVCFFLTFLIPYPHAYGSSLFSTGADNILGLPAPGSMVNLSPAYQPVMIRGLTVHKDNPFLFDFIVDVGQDKMSGEPLKKEGEKLIKYFLASLAIPDKDVWVNLSPYEKDKIIPDALGKTDLGRDLLEQDYILKQITASLIYPEKQIGKVFWDKVYAKAQAMYGTTEIPVNTFNKVWIMADRAKVFEHNQTAFVVDQHLKVMLEEDYLALQKHRVNLSSDTHTVASQIVREIVLPELEKEVNTGKNFANLRQIFNSVILSSWYKNNLQQALLNQVYADKSKVKGIQLNNPNIKQKIYEQYLKAYKKGVFNYIKEDTVDGENIPRKYFSGGIDEAMAAHPIVDTAMNAKEQEAANVNNGLVRMDTGMAVVPTNRDPMDINFMLIDGETEASFGLVRSVLGFIKPLLRSGERDINKLTNRYITDPDRRSTDINLVRSIIKLSLGDGRLNDPVPSTVPHRFDGSLESTEYPLIRVSYTTGQGSGASEQSSGLGVFDTAMVVTIQPNAEIWLPTGNSYHIFGIEFAAEYLVSNNEGKYEVFNLIEKRFDSVHLGIEIYVRDEKVFIRNTSKEDFEVQGAEKTIRQLQLERRFQRAAAPRTRLPILSTSDRDSMLYQLRNETNGKSISYHVPSNTRDYFLIWLSAWVKSWLIFNKRAEANASYYAQNLLGYIEFTDSKAIVRQMDTEITFRVKVPDTAMATVEPREKTLTIERDAALTTRQTASFDEILNWRLSGDTANSLSYGLKGFVNDRRGTMEIMDYSGGAEIRMKVPLEDERLLERAVTILVEIFKDNEKYRISRQEGSIIADSGGDYYSVNMNFNFRPKPTQISKLPTRMVSGSVEVGKASKRNGRSPDKAMAITPGGIDLNTSNGMQWDVSTDGKGVEMDIDPAMLARIMRHGIASLSPVIFRITPITSLWPIIGMNAPAKP